MTEITLHEYQQKIENKETFVIDFYAEWCAACMTMLPTVTAIATESDVPFYKANIDVDEQFKEVAKIKAIPMLLMYKQGRMVEFVYGITPVDKIKQKLRRIA